MSTALAKIPKPMALEFRRCTGNCCNPVKLPIGPGDLRRHMLRGVHLTNVDEAAYELWEYIGWRPPSRGGWAETGCHEYSCRARLPNADCAVHGTKHKPFICQRHPEYGGTPWRTCDNSKCTRRVMVLNGKYPLRHRFPDLWDFDKQMHNRTNECEAMAAPEAQHARFER